MINSRSIADLHPALMRGAAELKRRLAAAGHDMLITSTYRDGAAQNTLYAKGRTAPGQVVTNARAGQSIHNYRLAFDICKNIKGQEYSDASFFELAGRIWQDMGGEWGGAWTSFPDRPHFQFTDGVTLAQLQKGIRLADNVQMKWELVDKGTAQAPAHPTRGTTREPYYPLPNVETVTEKDRELLCKLVHHESRGEDELGMMLVVFVVLNRVASKGKGFPNNIYNVIYQPGGFSPAKRADFNDTIPTLAAVKAVNKALDTKDTFSQGALYFCNDNDLKTGFFANAIADGRIVQLFRHGGHIFLK